MPLKDSLPLHVCPPLRSLSPAGLPDVVIFCWKFLLAALVQFFFVLWGRGGPPSLKCLCGCWKWVAIGAVCTTGAAFNTISNLETTSVSALLFFYAAPLWALCFGVLLLRERLQLRTLVAVGVALAGVCLLFVPSLLSTTTQFYHGGGTASRHGASFIGDLLGLLSGLAMAGYLTTCRHANLFKPEAPMVLGVAFGSLGAALIGMYLAGREGHSLLQIPMTMWPLLLADCLGIGLYGIMSALATSYADRTPSTHSHPSPVPSPRFSLSHACTPSPLLTTTQVPPGHRGRLSFIN